MAKEQLFEVGQWVKNKNGKFRYILAWDNNEQYKVEYNYESAHAPGNFVRGSVWVDQDKLEAAPFEPDYVFWKWQYIELALLTHDKELFNKVMEANEKNEQKK